MEIPSASSSEYGESCEGFLGTVNDFFVKYGLDPVTNLTEISASTFVAMYEIILGDRLAGTLRDPVTREDEIANVQCLIDSLADDFLHCDLSHITGVAVVDGHLTSIQYLLEIFLELESFLTEQISSECSREGDAPQVEDLDEVTKGTVNAISEVLREEGLRTSPAKDGNDTETSLRSADSRLPSSISGDLEQHQIESDLSMEELINLGDRAIYGGSLYQVSQLPSSRRGLSNSNRGFRTAGGEVDDLIPSRDHTETKESLSSRNHLREWKPAVSRHSDVPVSVTSLSHIKEGPTIQTGLDPQRDPMTVKESLSSVTVDPSGQQNTLQGPDQTNGQKLSRNQNQSPKNRQKKDEPNQRKKQSNVVSSLDASLCHGTSSKPFLSHSMNSTSSTMSSAAWPVPPSSKDRYGLEAELASLGTGIQTKGQQHRGTSARETSTITQRHTHTHHHYHQPVMFDADKVGRKPVMAASLPLAPAPQSTGVIPPASSSSLSPPARSTSVPTSPKYVYKDYPSREAFISLTPPSRQSRHQPKNSSQRQTQSKLEMGERRTISRDGEASEVKPSNEQRHRRCQKVSKSRSWDDDVGRSEKTAGERSLHKDARPKSRSFEMEGTRPGPSRTCRAESPMRRQRKVAFLVDDDEEDEEDDEVDRLTELALLAKLRSRLSSSDEDTDSDVSVQSDSIVDYQRSFGEDDHRRRKRHPQRKVSRSQVSGSLLHAHPAPTAAFDDALDAQAKGAAGKIRRKIVKEKRQRDIERKTLQFLYSAGLKELQREMEEQTAKRKRLVEQKDREYRQKVLKKPKTSTRRAAGKYTAKLIPPSTPEKGTRRRGQRSKRKRSPSPRFRRQKRLTVADDEVLPVLLSEFPFLHVSPEAAHSMWTNQLRQVEQLTKVGMEQSKQNKIQKKIEDAERRQKLLMGIMKKELAHNQRMRDLKEKQEKKALLQRKEREKRQVTARARRYYDEFRLQAKSRIAKRKTKEEKIFRNLFDEALKIQKSRIADLRKYARDQREKMTKEEQNQIESMENYYRDRFKMLAETLEKERYELSVRDNAQSRVLDQMRRAMRRKMEDEIREFQDRLCHDEDAAYFRQLEADRMRDRLRTAAYKTQL